MTSSAKPKGQVFILRGLPGSGKSTVATLFPEHRIFCTDDLFMTPEGYKFDPSKLGEYHQQTFDAFCRAMKEPLSRGVYVVDNTNTRRWEYERYVEIAEQAGFQAIVVIVGNPKDPDHVSKCIARNIHNVPASHICKMSRRFEL